MKNLFNKKEYIKKRKGFTILETLVAVFILTISITGPLAFAQSGLRTAFLARDQITAFFLAQDAIEAIKNIRDQNLIDRRGGQGIDWLNGLGPCNPSDPGGGQPCNIDTTKHNLPVTNCQDGEECPPMKYDDRTGQFTPSGGRETTFFRRTVYIKETVPDQRASVVVLVTWSSRALSGTRKIVIQENITNWYPSN